ncbi:peptidoglycan-binding protein [Lysobacter sp. 22409]|uniref:peptidoglycan-binding protein n=1 Tax=Lysobacter sp. 22409 TaxID=3453917 RepID=UPI003F82B191
MTSPSLTSQQAIELLRRSPEAYRSPEQLRQLAAQVDADSPGQLTVLYSGPTAKGVWSSDVIDSMVEANEDVRVINKSEAAKFLKSRDFFSAVADAYDIPVRPLIDASYRGPAADWLYHPTEGPWADASARFADKTVGEVRAIASDALPSRVFGAIEVPHVLANPNVTTVEGIPRDVLVARQSSHGTQAAFEMIVARARDNVGQLQVAVNYAGMPLRGDSGLILTDSRAYMVGTQVEGKTPGFTTLTRPLADRMNPPTEYVLAGEQHFADWQAQVAQSERAMEAARAAPIRRMGAAVGLGVAASIYDAKQTGDRIGTLLAQDNPLAAQSQFAHYAARGTGGWLGGAAAGLAVGWETGPGAIAFVAVGAIAGSEVGEKVAQWWDERQVYNQTDRDGVDWKYNGKQWLRQEPGDLRDDGVTIAEKQSFAALPDKARELTYLASNSSSALAMGKLEPPRDPYVLPANETDKHSFAQADWQRNAETGDWVRQVVIARTDRGHPLVNPEKASPERAAELDRMSEQVVRENIASGPAPIAARYEQAYRRNGWDAFGPMPEPVLAALAEPNSLQASDGHQYRRDDEGQWQRQDGLMAGRQASGNLQRELDTTRAELQTQLVQHDRHLLTIPQWQAPSLDEKDRANVMSTYAALGIKPNPERLDAVMDALQRTREAHGIDPHASSLHVERSPNGGYDIDSPLAHLRRDNGVVQIVAVTSTEDIQQAVAARRERAPPIPDTPELRVATLSPQQREAHQQAEREANRQGLSRDEVQQAAQQAAVATASPELAPSVPALDDAQPVRMTGAPVPPSDLRREAEPTAAPTPSPAPTVAAPAPIAETAPEPERPQAEAAAQAKTVAAESRQPESPQAEVPLRASEPAAAPTAFVPGASIEAAPAEAAPAQPAANQPAAIQPAVVQPDSAQPATVAPAIAASSAANKQDDVLRPGDRGQEVELLQYRLHRVGYRGADGEPLAQNGEYDAATEQAVRQFQRDQGLADTGMADPATQQAMSAAQHARIESSKSAGQNPPQAQARTPALPESDAPPERPAAVARRDDEAPSQAAREFGSRAPSNEEGARSAQPAERPQPTEFIAQDERAAPRPQTDEAQQPPARETANLARDEQPQTQAPARSHEPAQQADAFAPAAERTTSPRTTETAATTPTREPLRESAREPAPMTAQPEPLFSLSRLTPNDQAMFAKIRAGVPADVPDETVAKAMLEAKLNGIPDADRIDKAAVVDGKLWVAGTIPGFHAGVSVAEQAPAMQDTLRETQSFNQQRDERLAQESTQKAQDEPGRAARMQ